MSEYLWKKREAASENTYAVDKLKKVLVLYTGGTIGMKWTEEGKLSSALVSSNHNVQPLKYFSLPFSLVT